MAKKITKKVVKKSVSKKVTRKPVKKSVKKQVRKPVKKSTRKKPSKIAKVIKDDIAIVGKVLHDKKKIEKIEYDLGKTSFVFGVTLSIIVGITLGSMNIKLSMGIGIIYSIIFILGLIVGLLNITIKEVNEFLMASITFLVASGLNIYIIKMTLPKLGFVIQQIFFSLGVFVAPAATIVALKAMYELAKSR